MTLGKLKRFLNERGLRKRLLFLVKPKSRPGIVSMFYSDITRSHRVFRKVCNASEVLFRSLTKYFVGTKRPTNKTYPN